MNSLILREWAGKTIRQRQDGCICLTDMAQASGKKMNDWLRLKSTSEYLQALEGSTGIPPANLIEVNESNGSNEERGTWAHRKIAIRFAQWCSVDFAVQVDEWVEELLVNGFVLQANATQQQLEAAKLKIAELEQQKLEAFEQGKLAGASEGYFQQANHLGTLLRKFITSGKFKSSASGSVPMTQFNMEFVRWCNQTQNTAFRIPVDGEQGRAIYVALAGLLPESDPRRQYHCGEFWSGNSKLKLQLEVAEPNWQGVANLYGVDIKL